MVDFDGYNNAVSTIEHKIGTGGINLLINNAGIMLKDTIRNVTQKSITQSFELNAMAPLLFTKVSIEIFYRFCLCHLYSFVNILSTDP